jgi:hypothetical protein
MTMVPQLFRTRLAPVFQTPHYRVKAAKTNALINRAMATALMARNSLSIPCRRGAGNQLILPPRRA